VGDTLYRTLKSYDEIAQRQAIQLQDLSEEFEKLRMQSEYASTLSLGLAVSPSRTASPAGKSPFAREQRRYHHPCALFGRRTAIAHCYR
jgi:hypothetical protein